MNPTVQKLRDRCLCGRVAVEDGHMGTMSKHPCHYCEIRVEVLQMQYDYENLRNSVRRAKEGFDTLLGHHPPVDWEGTPMGSPRDRGPSLLFGGSRGLPL